MKDHIDSDIDERLRRVGADWRRNVGVPSPKRVTFPANAPVDSRGRSNWSAWRVVASVASGFALMALVFLAALALPAPERSASDAPPASSTGERIGFSPPASAEAAPTPPASVPRPTPSPMLTAGAEAPTSLIDRMVSPGDAVSGIGVVVGRQGELALCTPRGWIGVGGTPDCGPLSVALSGIDVDTLPAWEVYGSAGISGHVRVTGTWNGDELVAEVVVEEPYVRPQRMHSSPCHEPTEGWPGDVPTTEDGEARLRVLDEIVESSPERFSGYWSALTDPAATHPRQVIVVGTVDDPAAVHEQLAAVFPYNLCVAPADYSAAELAPVAALLTKPDYSWQAHVEPALGRVVVRLPVLDADSIAALEPYAPMLTVQAIIERSHLDTPQP